MRFTGVYRRLALLVLAAAGSSSGLAGTLALTFDDGLDPAKEPRAVEWNAQLLANLKAAHITSAIFPTLTHTGTGGKVLVRRWSEAGHAVGNHTSRHRNLGSAKVSLPGFIEDVEEAEAAFRDLPTWVRLLRFPYLKEGDTREKRDGMRAWLVAHGYATAAVSIDASDWYFNQVYLGLLAKADAGKLATLQRLYIAHLLDRAAYYDALAVDVLHRSPSHVMLLHVNAINAAWLPQVIQALSTRGWTIISPVEAFKDPVYRMAPDVVPAGESLIWSLAKAAGKAGLRYPAEDSVYEEPALRAQGLLP